MQLGVQIDRCEGGVEIIYKKTVSSMDEFGLRSDQKWERMDKLGLLTVGK